MRTTAYYGNSKIHTRKNNISAKKHFQEILTGRSLLRIKGDDLSILIVHKALVHGRLSAHDRMSQSGGGLVMRTSIPGSAVEGPGRAGLREPLSRNSTSSSFTESLAARLTSTLESQNLVIVSWRLPERPMTRHDLKLLDFHGVSSGFFCTYKTIIRLCSSCFIFPHPCKEPPCTAKPTTDVARSASL